MKTGIKDLDREILKWVDDAELLKICSVDKRIWNNVCDDNFLKRRLTQKYPGIDKFKLKSETWKIFFLRSSYYIAKMEEDFKFQYNGGNFIRQLTLLEKYPDINKLLFQSSKSGELDIVKYALKKGADIHAGEYTSTSEDALALASEYNRLDIVKYLIESGANVNGDNNIALRNASSNGHLEVVKYLVENGANIHDFEEESLVKAAANGHLEVVKYLVERGADVDADERILQLPVKRGYYEIVKYLLEHRVDPADSLIIASKKGHLGIVQLLFKHGANIHLNNNAALFFAKEKGHTPVVKYLMKYM
jgi:ankyrin repeat protein